MKKGTINAKGGGGKGGSGGKYAMTQLNTGKTVKTNSEIENLFKQLINTIRLT